MSQELFFKGIITFDKEHASATKCHSYDCSLESFLGLIEHLILLCTLEANIIRSDGLDGKVAFIIAYTSGFQPSKCYSPFMHFLMLW